jgi:nitrous oxide reductase accessory protein NosL
MIKSLLVFIVFVFGIGLNADTFSKKATLQPVLVQKGEQKPWCSVCGMNLKMFYKTSYTAELDNHEMHQYCSIRCLVVDDKKHHIDMSKVKVVDAKTQKLIEAHSAFYVVGSKVKGTMSKVSKLAFTKKSDAEAFVKKFKGHIVTFEDALAMARKSLKKDMMMLSMKKKKKIYPMGKKIFSKKCNKEFDLTKYSAINQLKVDMKKNCKSLNEKQLQMSALYLWDVKRDAHKEHTLGHIHVTKDEKCPICGMFVYKYPRWATQIFYANKHYSFDGVKDMMKYYFKHKNSISKILVTDYYTQKAIDATKAYYVMGSDVYGPMGAELIPFGSKESAETFMFDHRGKKIVFFKDIDAKTIIELEK